MCAASVSNSSSHGGSGPCIGPPHLGFDLDRMATPLLLNALLLNAHCCCCCLVLMQVPHHQGTTWRRHMASQPPTQGHRLPTLATRPPTRPQQPRQQHPTLGSMGARPLGMGTTLLLWVGWRRRRCPQGRRRCRQKRPRYRQGRLRPSMSGSCRTCSACTEFALAGGACGCVGCLRSGLPGIPLPRFLKCPSCKNSTVRTAPALSPDRVLEGSADRSNNTHSEL